METLEDKRPCGYFDPPSNRAVLKTSGRTYIVRLMFFTGTKEENEALRDSGKPYSLSPGLTLCYCNIEKNGKPYGATRQFQDNELEFINPANT